MVVAATLLVSAFTATGGAYAAIQPPMQDQSTGPFNPGIPSD
jgi:hypothetical protein